MVGEWRFSLIHCDILLTLDVMMCTASILNLCAISIDRYSLSLSIYSISLYILYLSVCLALSHSPLITLFSHSKIRIDFIVPLQQKKNVFEGDGNVS